MYNRKYSSLYSDNKIQIYKYSITNESVLSRVKYSDLNE